MTYAELLDRMSSDEFELRMALDAIKADECPHCGVEPRDLMRFHHELIKCPVCKNEYGKTVPVRSSIIRTKPIKME